MALAFHAEHCKTHSCVCKQCLKLKMLTPLLKNIRHGLDIWLPDKWNWELLFLAIWITFLWHLIWFWVVLAMTANARAWSYPTYPLHPTHPLQPMVDFECSWSNGSICPFLCLTLHGCTQGLLLDYSHAICCYHAFDDYRRVLIWR